MTITVRALAELEANRTAAMIAGDVELMGELFADGLVYTHSTGNIDTKSSLIEAIVSGRLRYRAVRRHHDRYAIFDAAAVIESRMDLDITAAGVERTVRAQATIVWARHQDRWQFVAWHAVPIPA